MATFVVQLTTDAEPRPQYEVDTGEYQRLVNLGILVNAPATPTDPDLFDQEVSQLVTDVNSSTHAAVDAVAGSVGSGNITDASLVGRSLITAPDAAAARTTIGAAASGTDIPLTQKAAANGVASLDAAGTGSVGQHP